MTAFESIVDYMRAIPRADIERANFMVAQVQDIPGWSGSLHYLFFEACIRFLPDNPSILMCGVYHGRDLFLLAAAAKFLKKPVRLTGVDLFSNEPCADWTEAQKKIGSWELNGFGLPPSMEAAKRNCPEAEIIKTDSYEFMVGHSLDDVERFNLVYLDTSHDYESIMEEIVAAKSIGQLISGDDYTGQPHWGVKRAVDEAFSSRAVFGDCIWLAQP